VPPRGDCWRWNAIVARVPEPWAWRVVAAFVATFVWDRVFAREAWSVDLVAVVVVVAVVAGREKELHKWPSILVAGLPPKFEGRKLPVGVW